MGIIYPADWYWVNVQRSKLNGDKSPLSPYIPPDLDANSISDNHPFLYANLFIQVYCSTAWLFNEFAMAQNIILTLTDKMSK